VRHGGPDPARAYNPAGGMGRGIEVHRDRAAIADRVKLIEPHADSIPSDIMDVHFMPTLSGEGSRSA